MQSVLLLQDNTNLFSLGIIKKVICFSQFELIFEIKPGHISISLVYKKLRAIVGLSFSNILQSNIFDGDFILSQLDFFINGLILEIFTYFLHNLVQLLQHIETYSFFGFVVTFFFFIQSGEAIHEPPRLEFIS